MRLFVVGLFLVFLATCASAKPAPDAETLRFLAASIRAYSWADFGTPDHVRIMQRWQDIRLRRNYFLARAQFHASHVYLLRLSPHAFRRRLADALYLTTPRSRVRCAVAYVAALRGVDMIGNCRRMNDSVLGIRPPRKAQAWETRLMQRLVVGSDTLIAVYMNVLTVPSRLIDVYREHPDDRVLAVIYEYPAGEDGEGAMQMDAALATAMGLNPNAMLRAAVMDERRMRRLLRCLADHNLTRAQESVVLRAYRLIARSGGPLAAPARRCLESMARSDTPTRGHRP